MRLMGADGSRSYVLISELYLNEMIFGAGRAANTSFGFRADRRTHRLSFQKMRVVLTKPWWQHRAPSISVMMPNLWEAGTCHPHARYFRK